MRCESRFLAFSNSRRRVAVRPRPPRLMKYVSMRMPDPGPLGETFLDARVRAIVAASLVNKPSGGCVESVVTFATQRFFGGDIAGSWVLDGLLLANVISFPNPRPLFCWLVFCRIDR